MLPKPKHLKRLARANRKAPTLAERLLRKHLRGERFDGLRFRTQYVIAGYIVDFVCLRARVIIELDGWSHDDTYEADRKRESDLRAEGFEFLRYDNMAVIGDPSAIAESISYYCVQRAKLLYGEDYNRRRDTRSTPPAPGGERSG